ncbi:hypothetical protein B0A48_13544 [Cryoendolithus antarcticus]|uniref:Uncharacterized protein n=1 Tax=Cryoendolithus antarcticus TaxID=1507870 RepID=A0A1V8SNW2_9PEZI|nr:hypothetical protein B0A48_13544 [Cryoendolithus antarcticus]
MPPIKLNIDQPITPQKGSAVIPQIATEEPTRTTPANAAANTTATPSNASAYPAAQPGAPPVPGPTPFVSKPPPQASRTTQPTLNDNPPPPQPGAVPIPLSSTTSSAPPPPSTSAFSPESTQSTPFTRHLNQMHTFPSPSQNQAPTHSTSTNPPSTPARKGPITLNLGPVNPVLTSTGSSGPPGYTQNAYAQELSPAQRASLDAQTQEERRGSWVGAIGGLGGAGGGGSAGTEGGAGEGVASAWGAVKGWVGAVGEKAAEVEGEVWRRINGPGK